MRNMLVLAVISVLGCGGPDARPAPEPAPTAPIEARPGPAPLPAPVTPAAAAPALGDEDALAVGNAVNGLAVAMAARLGAEPGNLAYSPASIEAALAMTAAGARGETATEMHRVLHLGDAPDAAIDRIATALRRWDDPSRTTYTLRVANRLFGETSYTFEQPFLDRVEQRFAAPLERVDFRSASEAARVHINGWVAQHTQDRIRDLLPPGSIDSSTRLALVNAVYLDARWQVAFERERTRPAAFHLDGGADAEVPTMRRRGTIAHATIDGATVVELPYRGGEIAMRFVLPPEGVAPHAWITEGHLADPTPMVEDDVDLSLPKFRIETRTIPLADHLRALGIVRAFDRELADFTGIAAPPDPRDRLHISAVFHKAFVRVDEEGTEAAAATAVVMARGGGMPPQEEPVVIRFDRPFLFLLRDVRTGATLFAGRVSDPR